MGFKAFARLAPSPRKALLSLFCVGNFYSSLESSLSGSTFIIRIVLRAKEIFFNRKRKHVKEFGYSCKYSSVQNTLSVQNLFFLSQVYMSYFFKELGS